MNSGRAAGRKNDMNGSFINGYVDTECCRVPRVSTELTWRDRLGGIAMRWDFGRDRYLVEPGLYAAGAPGPGAPVLVSANYKLSFDALRRELGSTDAWILVLDTKGVNVWCAAGKGTFGTDEVVRRVEATGLARLPGNPVLIIPQLGAPGVSAGEVRKKTGFRAVFGPVRAGDIPAFLAGGMKVVPGMRDVKFNLYDRLAVVPVEMVQRFWVTVMIMVLFFLGAGVGPEKYSLAFRRWPLIAVAVWSNFLAGIVITPALLPWLPGRAFALKGAAMGLLTGALLWLGSGYGLFEGSAVLLMSLAACSYLGLMFTGSTTYTSASGVRREIAWALPLQIIAAAAGVALWIAARWLPGGVL